MPDRALRVEDLERSLPDLTAPQAVDGLEGEVEIFRDRLGAPHVRAMSAHDAFFGQGFATAQDRLWHMEYDRRRAYGRWAEYVGKPGLDQDLLMRRFQIRRSVERDYGGVNADAKAMLDAYAAGVNAFIETTGSLPIEYSLVDAAPERWEPWDCLAVYKARHILMGGFENKLWRAALVNSLGPEAAAELYKGYQPGHLLIVPPGVDYSGGFAEGLTELGEGAAAIGWLADRDSGSNNWAVAGSRTASGKPLVAGDPHRALDVPNVYYQNHIACAEFDAIGLSFPGFPGFPHFGHNAHVAWCVTHAMADYQDLYIERFDERGLDLYDYGGGRQKADVSHEVVRVKDDHDVRLRVATTRHGPVILEDTNGGRRLAFKYTATDGANLFCQAIIPMLSSRSADELEESMRGWVDPCNNFTFADVHGDIGYLNRGRVPLRPAANSWLPVPGWTGDNEWEGYVPFEELPRMRNPENGLIVTANNRIVGEDYPYLLSLDYAPEYRARRIAERLEELEGATVDDMAAIHSDKVSLPARVYSGLLTKTRPLDERSERAVEILRAWDGTMDRDGAAPTIYSAFRMKLNRRVLEHVLGPLAAEALDAPGSRAPAHIRHLESLLVTHARDGDGSLLPADAEWAEVLAEALAEAVAWLGEDERLGEDMDDWLWSKVHFTRPRHTLSDAYPDFAELLDPPSVSVGGDGDTPQASSYAPSAPFVTSASSVARYVFDTSDWDNSRWIVPLGVSGNPGSPHYADQLSRWSEVELSPMLYSWDRISEEAESVQTLR